MTSTIGQRFKPDDRVREANAFGRQKDTFGRRVGVVTECIVKKNKAGHRHFHYYVLWEGKSRPDCYVQQRLKHV